MSQLITTTKSYKRREVRQEKILLIALADLLGKNKIESDKLTAKLENQISQNHHDTRELKQENLILNSFLTFEKQEKYSAKKKYYSVIMLSVIAITVVSGSYSFLFFNMVEEQYMVSSETLSSGYVIQNLRGDTINTWISWRLIPEEVLYVNIINADRYSDEKIRSIKKAIQSEEIIEIDDSLLHKGPMGMTSEYFLGWEGALKAASASPTEFYIPVNFEFIQSTKGEGDITIRLENYVNSDGFTGWTNSIADESNNQILKSQITLFDVDSLTPNQLEIITRHEFGHALGLAHSTAPEDLMFPTIESDFPYISECNVQAIISLYDKGERSEVVCEK